MTQTNSEPTLPLTVPRTIAAALAVLTLAACGGGGGGGGGGAGGGGGTPPPPAATTYSVTLTGIALTDRLTDEDIVAGGLPLDGATATRSP